MADDNGTERRRGTGDVQRDLGRMESDIKGLAKTVTDNAATAQRERDALHKMAADHVEMDRHDHAGLGARIDGVAAALTIKIENVQTVLSDKLDALVLAQAEQKGGWKMLGLVGLGGGTIGGGVATLLGLFNGK
jgi:hypothetical protein